MATTSASLLDRLRAGPADPAWQRLYELYLPLIQKWLLRDPTLGPDADDIAQDVMTTVFQELPAFRRQRTGSFRNWLRTIAMNRLNAFWAKRNRRAAKQASVLSNLEDPDSDLSRAWDQEHDRHVFRKLLAMIEPEFQPGTWEAFRQTVLEERPAAEVAVSLDSTVGAVLQAKSRVLKRFREEAAGLLD